MHKRTFWGRISLKGLLSFQLKCFALWLNIDVRLLLLLVELYLYHIYSFQICIAAWRRQNFNDHQFIYLWLSPHFPYPSKCRIISPTICPPTFWQQYLDHCQHTFTSHIVRCMCISGEKCILFVQFFSETFTQFV